jgi:hypothetical protein
LGIIDTYIKEYEEVIKSLNTKYKRIKDEEDYISTLTKEEIFRTSDYLLSVIDLPKEKFGMSRIAFELLLKMLPYIDSTNQEFLCYLTKSLMSTLKVISPFYSTEELDQFEN